MIVNGIIWAAGLSVPKNGANVNLVGEFEPTMYGFQREEGYWQKKKLKVSDFDL